MISETGPGLRTHSVIVPGQQHFKAGILSQFIGEWQKITTDPVVLQAVRGLRIPLNHSPPLRLVTTEELTNMGHDLVIDSTVKEMLNLNAIQLVHKETKVFISKVFTVPKLERGKEYGRRFILNLKVSIRSFSAFP